MIQLLKDEFEGGLPVSASKSPRSDRATAQANCAEPAMILGKPVFWVNTHPLNDNSGFVEKRLCDGLTFTTGTACPYSCQYCYVASQVLKQKSVHEILESSGRQFNEIVIRRSNALQHLAQDLTRKKQRNDIETAGGLLAPAVAVRWGLNEEWSLADRVPKFKGPKWEGKVIFGSPLVDVAATKVLATETIEICEMILRLTDLDIRLLSKSPLLAHVGEELDRRCPDPKTGAKARVIFGLSTGILEDNVARVVECHTPSPSARLKALHKLQDNGFRTYGMLCPILPQRDEAAYQAYAQHAMQAIRAEECEEVWAEGVNFRVGAKADGDQRDSFQATMDALMNGGFAGHAALFDEVARDRAAWEQYCRNLFTALADATPAQTVPNLIVGEKSKAERPTKLWWLQYPQDYASIRDYWDTQQVNGAVLLGAVVTRYRKPKKEANKPEINNAKS